jgi:hypothetical protein
VRPPIFVVSENGEVQSFASVDQAEDYFREFNDVTSEGGEAWGSGGAPLALTRSDRGGVVLGPSAEEPEPERLRAALVAELDRIMPGAKNDLPLEEVVPIAARMFSVESNGLPWLIAYAGLLVAVGAAAYWLFFR